MPAWFIIFLFLLITGIAKLYMWLGVTDLLKAIIAATLTTFVIVCALRRSGQKRDEQKEREKTAAAEKEKIQSAQEPVKTKYRLDADDAAFLSAVGTGLILHELHERNKEQERASRDYDGNWDNPDDDSQYDDSQYDDWE
ncbi:MAG: hypothetical protein MSA62_09830 [Megasphaera elsdenii]|nr:hypothetical protein [Megasphaera elsdenii]